MPGGGFLLTKSQSTFVTVEEGHSRSLSPLSSLEGVGAGRNQIPQPQVSSSGKLGHVFEAFKLLPHFRILVVLPIAQYVQQ